MKQEKALIYLEVATVLIADMDSQKNPLLELI